MGGTNKITFKNHVGVFIYCYVLPNKGVMVGKILKNKLASSMFIRQLTVSRLYLKFSLTQLHAIPVQRYLWYVSLLSLGLICIAMMMHNLLVEFTGCGILAVKI